MPQIIDVPGYGEVEFPDDYTDDAIVAAIRSMQQEQPQQPQMYDPAEGMTPVEKRMAGMSAQVRGFGRGISSAIVNAAMIGNPYRDRIDAALRKVEDERRRLDAPLMGTPEGRQGALAGGIATAIPAMAIPGGQSVGGGALVGGALGALQPVGTDDSRLGNVALGGAFGAAGPAAMNALGRVARPIKSALSPGERSAVGLLQQEGVPLSVAQRTGSRNAQGVERFLADNPVTAGRMATELTKRQKAFTRATLRTIGENADSATPEVLGAARTRIGSVMDDVESRYSPDITGKIGELAQIADEAKRVLPDDGKRVLTQIDRIVNKAGATGRLDAKTLAGIRRELDALSKQADVSEYAVQIKTLLQDALQEATQGTDDFARYQTARRQYRNLQAIADSADTTANGIVQAGTLANRLKTGKHTRNSFRYGSGDDELARMARSMSTVLDRFPNSGTTARVGAQLLPGAAAGTASLAMGGDPAEAAKWAALGYAGPQLIARLVNSPRMAGYLANGVPLPASANELAKLLRPTGLAAPNLLTLQSGN